MVSSVFVARLYLMDIFEKDENPSSSLTGWDEFPGTLPRPKNAPLGRFFNGLSSPITPNTHIKTEDTGWYPLFLWGG